MVGQPKHIKRVSLQFTVLIIPSLSLSLSLFFPVDDISTHSIIVHVCSAPPLFGKGHQVHMHFRREVLGWSIDINIILHMCIST